jgi:DNA-binding MarR family transcriptional regulator
VHEEGGSLQNYIVLRYNKDMAGPSQSKSDDLRRLQTLAEFRYALRQFLHFSELCSTEAGLHPQQHQLLLHIAGAPDGVETTISYAAERLGLRHHSVVELSKRCAEAGLIQRLQTNPDHRFVVLQLTPAGESALESLSEAHARELNELAPKLIATLNRVRKASPEKSE